MYKEDEIIRIKSIQKKIDSIHVISKRHKGIVNSLKDADEAQPVILMLLIAIAEQFNKLQKHQSNILENFKDIDLKGIISVRNFIAHDYDGINLSVIENGIRYELPLIEKTIKKILNNI